MCKTLDLENCAEAAEVERDEYHAPPISQDLWNELDRWFSQADIRNADAQAQFDRIASSLIPADGGGYSGVLSGPGTPSPRQAPAQ